MLPVAILCGGKGTRIASIAGDLPKALVPVAGEPFLAHQLRWLRNAGATNVVLLTGYRGDRVRAFARDGAAFGLRIAYSDDGGSPRGTAGAVARAIPLLGEAFITVYGDALLSADPGDVAAALLAPYDGVMTVFRNEDRWQPSNVRTDGERVAAYDKHAPPGAMTHVDYGINAFRAADFARVTAAGAAADLAQVHGELIARGALRALEVSERWYDIGSPEGLAETERHLREANGAP
jgi:NDP-sugar pyrophosphorylase family protein